MEARARREVDKGGQDRPVQADEAAGAHAADELGLGQRISQGDPLAVELIDRAVGALGAGIASAVNLLDVEAVVIGGGLGVRFGQPFAERIATEMHPHLFNDTRPPAVRVAGLGDVGGAIGASLLARPQHQ